MFSQFKKIDNTAQANTINYQPDELFLSAMADNRGRNTRKVGTGASHLA